MVVEKRGSWTRESQLEGCCQGASRIMAKGMDWFTTYLENRIRRKQFLSNEKAEQERGDEDIPSLWKLEGDGDSSSWTMEMQEETLIESSQEQVAACIPKSGSSPPPLENISFRTKNFKYMGK